MDRPNHLPSTLRSKKRYIAFQVMSEKKILNDDVFNGIWHSLLNFLGEYGTAKTGFWLLKTTYIEDKQLGLIKCNHNYVEEVRAGLAVMQRIGDSRVIVKVLGVSGTIKAAQKKFFDEVDLFNFT
ncbi:MAG: ribonuclease P protein component 2 [Nanoarchaeota archaeon]|nr:ribonuclease P protein component 2 [Nanoarchaeota archaeon]